MRPTLMLVCCVCLLAAACGPGSGPLATSASAPARETATPAPPAPAATVPPTAPAAATSRAAPTGVVARSTAVTTGPRITAAAIAKGVQNGQPLEPTSVIPGATLGRLQIWGSDGLVVDDFTPKSQYQLAAGLYDVQVRPVQSTSTTAWFRVEVAANRDSTVPLGGMALTSRQAPAQFAIEDDAAARRVADGYTLPQQPFLLPPGRYTVQVKQSGGADWQIVQRAIEVQANTIVQVNL